MANSANKAKWDSFVAYCREHINEQQFTTWISPVSFCSFDAEKQELKIGVPSYFFYEFLEKNYAHLLLDAIHQSYGPDVRLFYNIMVVDNKTVDVPGNPNPTDDVSSTPPVQTPTNKPKTPKVPELDSHLMTEYSFDNFIEGESNLLPRSVGMSIAENPKQKTFNPLFIYGHSGVGKTHLVNAIGTKLKQNFPEKKVLYLSAHLFHVQFVDANLKNKTNEFIQFYQQIDVLILDDVHEFIGMNKTQNTFFHIFNHLKQNGKQIILTCDRAPLDLQGMEERLLTRFKWGLIAELGQPNEQLRHAILENKIQSIGLKIPKTVIDYISENVTDSVRELEGVVTSLMAYSVVYNRNIDIKLAQRIVGNATRVGIRPVTIDEIITHVCAHYKVNKDDIFTKSRKANVVEVRQVAMYLSHKLTKSSTSKIGASVGGRSHATVLHSISSIEEILAQDEKMRNLLDKLAKDIKMHKPVDKES